MGSPLSLDTETTGTRVWQGDKATVVSFATDDEAWALPADQAAPEIRRQVASGRPIVMHNATFDRAVLSTSFGIEIPDTQVRDTMVLDWLLREAYPHGLKDIGARLFGSDAKHEQKALQALMRGPSLVDLTAELHATGEYKTKRAAREAAKDDPRYRRRDWSQLTYDELEPYAIKDAELTLDVYHALMAEVATSQPDVFPAVEREMRVAGMIYRLNKAGVRVSVDRAEAALGRTQTRFSELESSFVGTDVWSPKQVAKLVYQDWGLPCARRTGTGAPSVDKVALERLRWHDGIARLLELRHLGKAITAYYVPLLDRLGPDGRVHPSFSAHRVVTGRVSCSQPNLMTIPREGTNSEIRELFEPEPGMVFVSADLPNAELRVTACMAKEPLWLASFENDEDLHQAMATRMGVERHVGKTCNFAMLYGAGAYKLSETLAQGTGKEPDVAGAKRVISRYWAAVPRIKQLMNGVSESWARRGYLPLWVPGRYRHYHGPYGPEPKHKALNSMVQGGVAELVKDWMLEVEPMLLDIGAQIVLQVHDSLVIETPMGTEDKVGRLLQEAVDEVNPYALPFPLDIKIGL